MISPERTAAIGSGATGSVRRRREVIGHGISDDEIRRRCVGGQWLRLRRGAYAEGAAFAGLDTAARHRVLAEAMRPALSRDAIFSHQSAAAIYGVPVWGALLRQVAITRDRRHGGRIRSQLKVHCAPVDAVAEVDGFTLTTPARTIVDLARTVPFEAAVVAGDALARNYGVAPDTLARELQLARRRHGIADARRVVAFLDPHSESVGESRSRVMLRRLGMPIPRSQGEVHGRDGQLVGRVDFFFGRTGVVAEFDGPVAYGRVLRPGDHPATTTIAEKMTTEKKRDALLRDNGLQVVRWTSGELATDAVAPRLQAALARARAHRPDGYIRQARLPEPKPLRLHRV